MKGNRSVSDSHLMRLWRQAVLIHFNNTCPLCGWNKPEDLQCHHVVFRRHAVLRYDWRNGIPLCNVYNVNNQKYGGQTCHQYAHTFKGENEIRQFVDVKYLEYAEAYRLKEFLMELGVSRNQFLLSMKDDLQRKIEQGY